jgi:hypothetical protein
MRALGGRWSRLAWPAGFAISGVALFLLYLHQSSRTTTVNSDGASNALQAWAMLHGNVLLHGWTVSDVSFYTTELPQYVLVEAIRGLRPDVVHICGAMTYTVLVLLAGALAMGREATGLKAIARATTAAAIMLAPQLGNPSDMLLLSPDHGSGSGSGSGAAAGAGAALAPVAGAGRRGADPGLDRGRRSARRGHRGAAAGADLRPAGALGEVPPGAAR